MFTSTKGDSERNLSTHDFIHSRIEEKTGQQRTWVHANFTLRINW